MKLTLSARKKKTDEEIIYASDVLVAIKPAINEINKLALTPNIAGITGLATEDIFIIKYKITGKAQDRIIYFYKEIVPTENTVEKTKIKRENVKNKIS